MEKAFQIQKQARDNAHSFQTYLTDLRNWEYDMKRKEAALNSEVEQELPPVRSKVRKEKPMVQSKPPEKRISASDYKAWEKFDVDQALEEVDMADVGPSSLDSKKSEADKKGKLREEALFEKEKGNKFVKESKWDDAISCYNRAIELINNDAIYYANRALCYLKKESYHQAERDCTESLKLDPTYVKAYQRRAAAREKLGLFIPASKDLDQIIKLEPHNKEASRKLQEIKSKIKASGDKSKWAKPSGDQKPSTSKQLVELSKSVKPKDKHHQWKNGIGEGICVIQPATVPPHLRSKKPLRSVPITEKCLGDIPKPVQNNVPETLPLKPLDETDKAEQTKKVETPESNKLVADLKSKEKKVIDCEKLIAPNSSFQFITDWKSMDENMDARAYYLGLIEPEKIPTIFGNCLESHTLSEIIGVLFGYRDKFKPKLKNYLLCLSKVKRFGALAMFMSQEDKNYITKMLSICENAEANELEQLRALYELN